MAAGNFWNKIKQLIKGKNENDPAYREPGFTPVNPHIGESGSHVDIEAAQDPNKVSVDNSSASPYMGANMGGKGNAQAGYLSGHDFGNALNAGNQQGIPDPNSVDQTSGIGGNSGGIFGDAINRAKGLTDKTSAVSKEQQQASTDAAISAAQQNLANSTSARNAGVSRAGSGLVGNSGANMASNQASILGANQANQASTQADWLATQGYTKALEQQQENANKGKWWNAAGAALTGAGTGAMLGASLSDETEKQAPQSCSCKEPSDDDLINSMGKIFDLYKQLKELKESK